MTRKYTVNTEDSVIFLILLIFAVGFFTAAAVQALRPQEIYDDKIVPIQDPLGDTRGTGFFIKLKDGDLAVMTNAHVCNGVGLKAMRTSQLNVKQKLSVIKIDVAADLCLLKLEKQIKHEYLTLSVRIPAEGEKLNEVGYPGGGPQTYSIGRFLGLQLGTLLMPLDSLDSCNTDSGYVNKDGANCVVSFVLGQTSVPTYPGNSGSPVRDSSDRWVGVMNSTDMSNGHGNFIPAPVVALFLKGM